MVGILEDLNKHDRLQIFLSRFCCDYKVQPTYGIGQPNIKNEKNFKVPAEFLLIKDFALGNYQVAPRRNKIREG